MNNLERLRNIVEANVASSEDKQFITDLSLKYEMPFEPQGKCKNCWIDQAILLHNKLKDGEPSPCSARLRDDIDVVINGYRINNATLTDELVEKYRGKGLPEHWFV